MKPSKSQKPSPRRSLHAVVGPRWLELRKGLYWIAVPFDGWIEKRGAHYAVTMWTGSGNYQMGVEGAKLTTRRRTTLESAQAFATEWRVRPNDESSDLRPVSARESEQREPQVRCDDWLGEPNKSGAPLAEKPAARSGVGGDSTL